MAERSTTTRGTRASQTTDGGDSEQAAPSPAAHGQAADAAARRMAGGDASDAKHASGEAEAERKQGTAGFLDKMRGTATGQQGALVDALSPDERLALTHLPDPLEDWMRPLVDVIFQHIPDGEMDTLEKMFSRRFRINTVGAAKDGDGQRGVDWDPKGLRAAWAVLEQLPPAQVEGNRSLTQFVRYKVTKNSQGEGAYENATKASGIGSFGYDPKTLEEVDHNFSDKKDPMYGVNAWNETVRHEVGHAVDQSLHASDHWCIGNASGGNWKDYESNYETVASELVRASGGAIDGSSQREALVKAIAGIMEKQTFKTATTELEKIPEWKKLSSSEQEQVKADPVLNVLKQNNSNAEPWMAGGGIVLGGRVFQESYDNEWTSYAAEARDRKVSKYQFRAQGEWFAEAYAAYYEPGPVKGAKLAQVDPKSKEWFDRNVDTKQPDRGGGHKAGD
jgi:hypothetical protein